MTLDGTSEGFFYNCEKSLHCATQAQFGTQLNMRVWWYLVFMIVALVKAPVAVGQGILSMNPLNDLDAQLELVPSKSAFPPKKMLPTRWEGLKHLQQKAVALDTLRLALDNQPHKTTGSLEVGGVYGTLPYTLQNTSPWNAYAKGIVGVELFGVPVKALVDVGTDLPVRGQRNSIRLAFDAPKLINAEKWGDANKLHALQSRLDSLEENRAAQLRKVKGAEDMLSAHRPAQNSLAQPSVPELPGTDLSVAPLDTITVPDIPIVELQPGIRSVNLDSLEQIVSSSQDRLNNLDKLVTDQRMKLQRLSATMNAAQGKSGIVEKITKGIKHFDLGSCSPSASEFLMNGINFQGLSFEYEQKDIYFSFDRGRSFDDTWLEADPVADRVRQLQQSLFFADVQDLNSRKLTAIKAGFGPRQGTHIHFGYLYGSTEDVPPGSTLSSGVSQKLTNHVAEVDLGYEVKQDHLLHVVFARSMVLAPETSDGPAINSGNGSGLFDMGSGHDQGFKVGWSSWFKGTKTRIGFEGGSISPYFQSLGMGYIRNGSKRVEGKIEQAIGQKIRFRSRLLSETRTGPGELQPVTHIGRWQLQGMYRPTSALAFRAGYLPVKVRTETATQEDVINHNRMVTMGGDVRKRWKKTVAVLSADVGYYKWVGPEGIAGSVENHSFGLMLLHGDRWSGRAGWSGISGYADTTEAADRYDFMFKYTTQKGAMFEAGTQLSESAPIGWSIGGSCPVSKQVGLGVRGQSVLPMQKYFQEIVSGDQNSSYNWTFFATVTW